jgi:hypothetical protein
MVFPILPKNERMYFLPGGTKIGLSFTCLKCGQSREENRLWFPDGAKSD